MGNKTYLEGANRLDRRRSLEHLPGELDLDALVLLEGLRFEVVPRRLTGQLSLPLRLPLLGPLLVVAIPFLHLEGVLVRGGVYGLPAVVSRRFVSLPDNLHKIETHTKLMCPVWHAWLFRSPN